MRPAVPLYCRCTPADLSPFLRKPVSSSASTASGSPRCSTTWARRSSRTASASQRMRERKSCTPSGVPSPAASASQLPAVLALQGREQPAQVGQCPPPRLRPAEAWRDPLRHHLQLPSPALSRADRRDRKSTRLNSSHANISYAVFCLKKKKSYSNISLILPTHYILARHTILQSFSVPYSYTVVSRAISFSFSWLHSGVYRTCRPI